MAGPALDPVKVQQFEAGFNGQDVKPKKQSAQALASKLAQAYAAQSAGGIAPSPVPSASSTPLNSHQLAMQAAAEEAKQKYMRENGVDENGDPILQK